MARGARWICSPRGSPHIPSALLLGASLSLTASARGDTELDRWLVKGRALFAEGRYAEACVELDLSPDESIGTWRLRARCHEEIDELASALAALTRARDLCRATRDRREGELADQARAMAARAGRLRIIVKAPEVEVRVDGAKLDPRRFGEAAPANRGPRKVVASANGRVFFERTILVEDGVEARIELPLPPARSRREPSAGARDLSATTVAGIVLGAAGGVTLGAGIVSGSVAAARESPGARDAAIGLSITGGVVALAGLALALEGKRPQDPRQTWVGPSLSLW
ncbi:MAG: hypothetical protein U0359_29045 [Byssovorax sp.]